MTKGKEKRKHKKKSNNKRENGERLKLSEKSISATCFKKLQHLLNFECLSCAN